MLAKGVSKERIWILSDSWYDFEDNYRVIEELGIYYMFNIPKSRQIRLFDEWMRVEKYFEKYKTERYFTSTKSGVKIYYKEAILDVSKIGFCKVFAFRPENETGYKYYISNKRNLKPKTAYYHYDNRWSIEDMHRSLKQFLGLKDCYSGKKDTNVAHKSMCYFLYWAFSIYKTIQTQLGFSKSIEQLWWEYTDQFDHVRISNSESLVIKDYNQNLGIT